jgi:hypothetical protein
METIAKTRPPPRKKWWFTRFWWFLTRDDSARLRFMVVLELSPPFLTS